MQFERIHDWLSNTYWSPGVSIEVIVKSAENSSLLLGAFIGEGQVGYIRAVSDRATFAWLCDVYVADEQRGKGLARWMVQSALNHPEHQGLRPWLLATKDAHGVYEKLGFEPIKAVERWIVGGVNPSAQKRLIGSCYDPVISCGFLLRYFESRFSVTSLTG